MSTTLSGNIQGSVNFNYAQPNTGRGDTSTAQSDQKSVQYTTGTTTANAANRLYSGLITLAGGASTTLDLQSLTDQLNLSLDFARIKGLQIHLLSVADNADIGTNATSINVGNATANQALQGNASLGFFEPANATFRVFNGGFISMATPNADGLTIDATHTNLKIENEDPSVTAKIVLTLIGADA